MTTITREQQKQILIDTANHVISRDNTSPYSENLRELARIALASLTAEPVAWKYRLVDINSGTGEHWKYSTQCITPTSGKTCRIESVPLYDRQVTQPAPVVPYDISGIIERFQYQADHLSEWHHIDEHSCKVNRRDLMSALEFMDSCRAAILNGGKS